MTQGRDPDYDALWGGAWQRAAAFGPGFRSRYETLLRLMAQFGAAGRFIEFGAGTGAFLPRVTRRFPWLELSAHEQSATALAALRALPALHGVYEGPLDAELQLGRAFDVAVCSEVLEHIEDDGAALDALIRHLRPGGRLYLSVPLRPGLWTRVDEAVGHVRRYRRGQLAELCRARGLEVLADLSTGFPIYNAYYRVLGRKSPEETAQTADRGLKGRLLAGALGRVFTLETRLSTPLGGRGFVAARLPVRGRP
mgnify:CR=1 FL=1